MLGRDDQVDAREASTRLHSRSTKHMATDKSAYSEDDQSEDGKDREDVVVGLFRAWLNEKATPELLPFPGDTIFGVRRLLEGQESFLESIKNPTTDSVYMSNLCLLETERLQYVLQDLVECRIRKMEAHWTWYYTNSKSSNLGEAEQVFLQRHAAAVIKCIREGVLAQLSSDMQHYPGEEDVDVPRLDAHVVFRALCDLGTIQLAPLGSGADAETEIAEGDVLVAPWSVVKPLLVKGHVVLL